jgi:hypothetical protein
MPQSDFKYWLDQLCLVCGGQHSSLALKLVDYMRKSFIIQDSGKRTCETLSPFLTKLFLHLLELQHKTVVFK